jgi:hypothetical protein
MAELSDISMKALELLIRNLRDYIAEGLNLTSRPRQLRNACHRPSSCSLEERNLHVTKFQCPNTLSKGYLCNIRYVRLRTQVLASPAESARTQSVH